MKRLVTNLRLIVPSAILLFVIILAQSLLEYRSGRKAALDLLSNQAEALIHTVSIAAEKGLYAYESQQARITEHLYTIGEMIERIAKLKPLTQQELDDILRVNDISILQLVDSDCLPLLTARSTEMAIEDVHITAIKCEDFDPERPQSFVGFVNLNPNLHVFAAVTIFHDRRAIIAGVNADDLLAMRRAFGAGSIIEALSQSPGLEYAAILDGISVLAASQEFPSSALDNWYFSQSSADSAFQTRTKNASAGNRDVFEVLSSFYMAAQPSGQIVIGLSTEYLDFLSSKLRSDIIWRSALFLFVALLAISAVIVRQNYRLLSKELGVMKDDVRRLEADRALGAKLSAMGELASGVAHEIRNPLNAISVIIQRLKREFEPKRDEAEYTELIDVIHKETERINNSVKQFLTLARPPVLNKTDSDINDCVRQVATLYEPCAREKKCELNISAGDIPPMNIDKELCRQAIVNLFDNALSAVDHDGLITVKTYRKGKTCFLDVADNGPGIPDEKKERVFDLYFTTKPTGTGMGLPTVLRIVKEHGGRVNVLDNPGGGTIFRLEFPLEQ